MPILTAHRILISSFVAFSLFLTAVEIRLWLGGGGGANLAVAGLSLAAAIGFAIYLRRIWDKREL